MSDETTGIGPMKSLYDALRRGELSRRSFMHHALTAGMALPVALYAANSVAAQTPVTTGAPEGGLEGKKRGEGGELRLLQWQAPTILAQHSALGGKDNLAATLILEPLTNYLPDGTLIPNLIAELPSADNGLLAKDNSSVTYKLKPGVTWSDGTPFTAHDVQFTWSWIMDEKNGATDYDIYAVIKDVEVVDDLTARLVFKDPQPAWYSPFSGSWWGAVYPKHILDGKGPDGYQKFLLAPIGTGPFVVKSFSPGDQVVYEANENYRDSAKPYYSRVLLKGGGDAASAARAVLQTGDYDFAWNLQIEPEVLAEMAAAGHGTVVTVPGAALEHIQLNFTDPTVEVDGEFSSLKVPHPFLTDKLVRKAFAAAIDRDLIAKALYGEGEPATANVLIGIPRLESKKNSFTFDVEEAKRLLDEAGWTMDGDTRSKDGKKMEVSYATTVNQVRQKTQAIVKKGLEEIGVKVQLKQVDGSVYFDSSAGNTQNFKHFYDDLGMSTANIDSPFPLAYMTRWYAGPDNSNVAQKANGWSGQDLQRYVSAEYDGMFEQVTKEIDPEKSADLFIQMNDLLVEDQIVIPLVQRAAEKLAVGSRLRLENIAGGSFETVYWNIANWTAAAQ
ncbi:MAG: peptide ABC transporter substrate-binding protein [Thermomicrobiales bacterium]